MILSSLIWDVTDCDQNHITHTVKIQMHIYEKIVWNIIASKRNAHFLTHIRPSGSEEGLGLEQLHQTLA